ncbi:MAG: tetratricopeptide repeat protein [Pyrinomonadaceae bacterium]|nr:tetratricopeptide repeat protein [Pyrinomonadaceae bacterium]
MKRCPECRRDYYDDTLLYCLEDGNALVQGSVPSPDEPATAILSGLEVPAIDGSASESPTVAQIHTTEQTAIFPTGAEAEPLRNVGSKQRQLAVLAIAVLILAVGGFFGYRYFSASGSKQINSIAVMPFENRNSDADTDYLSDGLAESVIFRLTQIPDLRVSPTSSVMRYKGASTDVAKIASELGVDAVMTGRLTKRGDNLNITVELVDARTNKSLWGEQYERKLSELLTTQREIVTEIVSKLQLKLSGEGEQKLAKNYTESPEAYQLYLKGRYYWNKRTDENVNKAIEQFKAAIDKDPNFALAYTGVADCYGVLPYYSTVISSEFLPQAKAYATRAIAIDSSLGEAHISLAIADLGLWNWAEAEKEFRWGLELNPNYAIGHQWYGQYLEIHGRYDAALTENKRARDFDPLSLTINLDEAMMHLARGDADSAIEACKRSINLDPNWYAAHRWLALSYLQKGRNSEALAEAEKSVDLSNRHSSTLGILGLVLAQTGKRSEALKIAEELKTAISKRQAKGTDVGWIYLGLNEKEEVFAWLEKDFESRNPTMPFRLRIPPLNSMSEDSRYKDLWKRMNLPE